MFCSSYLGGLWNVKQVAVSLLFCGVLFPGFVGNQHAAFLCSSQLAFPSIISLRPLNSEECTDTPQILRRGPETDTLILVKNEKILYWSQAKLPIHAEIISPFFTGIIQENQLAIFRTCLLFLFNRIHQVLILPTYTHFSFFYILN